MTSRRFFCTRWNRHKDRQDTTGIHVSLLKCCDFCLGNISQLVPVCVFKFDLALVPSGVPQGSHLEPLFIIMFNTKTLLSHYFPNSKCTQIAWSYIYYLLIIIYLLSINSLGKAQLLQDDLIRVHRWCVVTYFIHCVPLTLVSSIRDSCVVIDVVLYYSQQYIF